MTRYEGLKREELTYLMNIHLKEGYMNYLDDIRSELEKLDKEVEINAGIEA